MPLLFLAAAAAAPGPAGLYTSNQMEIGAALELSADGRFRYQLDYGAVSESGAGKWASDGRSVTLTSVPMPKPPGFILVSDKPLPVRKLAVRVADPHSPILDSLHVVVSVDGGAPNELRLSKDEVIDLPAGKRAILVPLVPVYGDAGAPIRLDMKRGHRLTLKFLPNDLGRARFDHERLAIDHGDLLLRRYDALVRFERTER